MSHSPPLEPAGSPGPNDALSPRERQMLTMATNGLTDQGIAHRLGISVATVNTYWSRVRLKFGPLPRAELVANFVRAEMARVNADLARNEARFRTVMEASPVGVVLTDAAGGLLYANPAFERIVGRDRETLTRDGIPCLLHPEDRGRVLATWERCLALGHPYFSEHRYVRSDGSVVWVRSQGESWRDGDAIEGRVSLVEDVTLAHEAEVARAEAELRYRALLSLAPEAIITVDETARIVEFNPGAERMFGYREREAVGEPLACLLPGSLRAGHDGHVRAFGVGPDAARPMASRREVRGLRRDGEEFACEASIMHQRIGGRLLYTAIVRDISNRPPRDEARP